MRAGQARSQYETYIDVQQFAQFRATAAAANAAPDVTVQATLDQLLEQLSDDEEAEEIQRESQPALASMDAGQEQISSQAPNVVTLAQLMGELDSYEQESQQAPPSASNAIPPLAEEAISLQSTNNPFGDEEEIHQDPQSIPDLTFIVDSQHSTMAPTEASPVLSTLEEVDSASQAPRTILGVELDNQNAFLGTPGILTTSPLSIQSDEAPNMNEQNQESQPDIHNLQSSMDIARDAFERLVQADTLSRGDLPSSSSARQQRLRHLMNELHQMRSELGQQEENIAELGPLQTRLLRQRQREVQSGLSGSEQAEEGNVESTTETPTSASAVPSPLETSRTPEDNQRRSAIHRSVQSDMLSNLREQMARLREQSQALNRDLGPRTNYLTIDPPPRLALHPLGLDSVPRPEPLNDEQMLIRVECGICLQQIANTACVPCGHVVMCEW